MAAYLKAVVAAAIAGLSSLASFLQTGNLHLLQWVLVLVATLVAFNAVYFVRNSTPVRLPGDTTGTNVVK